MSDIEQRRRRMNRDELLASAMADITRGNRSHPAMAQACYLGAIAKLLLAQASPDASASPPDHGETVVDPDSIAQHLARWGLCTVCARPRSECTCGHPRITDASEWLPGDPT